MPEVPKIVHERLRAGGSAPGAAHPDPNLLAAFAEQALSATERDDVLQHLAWCGECREALALSLPSLEAAPEAIAEEVTVPAVSAGRASSAGRRTWFAWNRLGWAGLTAGVVIAVGVLVMQPGRQKNVNEAEQKPGVPVAQPAGTLEANKAVPLPSSSEVATTAEKRPPAPASPAVTRRDELKKPAEPAAAPKEWGRPQVSAQETRAMLGHSSVQGTLQASAGKKDVQSDNAFDTSAPRLGSVTETVDVSRGAATLAPEPAQRADTLAQNEAAPVVRAKAARALDAPAAVAKTATADAKQEGAQASNEQRSMAYVVSGAPAQLAGANSLQGLQRSQIPGQWAIRGGNELQHSLDSGAHWKTVFQPHRPLLCVAAAGVEVWAGGKKGDLFHSADSGATWNQVHPSLPGQVLTDDITHIDVYSSTQIVLSTSKNESWSTSDGGKTWAKK